MKTQTKDSTLEAGQKQRLYALPKSQDVNSVPSLRAHQLGDLRQVIFLDCKTRKWNQKFSKVPSKPKVPESALCATWIHFWGKRIKAPFPTKSP